MESNKLKLECELLKRGNKNLIMGLMIAYVVIYIFTRFLTPSSRKGTILYEGLLVNYGLEEYLIYVYILQIGMLLLIGSVFWKILTLTLRIKGVMIISENSIEVIQWKKFRFIFKPELLKNLKVQFNYFKKNDTEPRNLVTGNNNIIEFSRYNKKFRFEFLLQTEEDDEIFRKIIEAWKKKKLQFEYKTVLTDF